MNNHSLGLSIVQNIQLDNPHAHVFVRWVSNYWIPMNKCTRIFDTVHGNREKKSSMSEQHSFCWWARYLGMAVYPSIFTFLVFPLQCWLTTAFHFISTYVYIILSWLTMQLTGVSSWCLTVILYLTCLHLPQKTRSFPTVQILQSLLDLNTPLPFNNFIASHYISYICHSSCLILPHPASLSHLILFYPFSSLLFIPLCYVAMVVVFPPVFLQLLLFASLLAPSYIV